MLVIRGKANVPGIVSEMGRGWQGRTAEPLEIYVVNPPSAQIVNVELILLAMYKCNC